MLHRSMVGTSLCRSRPCVAMTLSQLRQLVAIVDSGLNITSAARHVHATQSGLSKQLKQLENELGTLLFVRRGRALESLTPDGVEIVERARRILSEADNIRTHAANQRGEVTGTLIIVSTHTQARFVLPPVVANLRQRYPGVHLRLEPAGDVEIGQRLRDCTADVGLLSSAGPPPDAGLAVPLFRWSRKVLVPRGHELSQLTSSPSLADLARYPLVSYESSRRARSSLRQAFSAEGLRPEIAVTARDADLIKTYVSAGLGVGILAEIGLGTADAAEFEILPAPPNLPDCIAWAMLPAERVARQYTVELILGIAPWLDRHDLRRALAGVPIEDWGRIPHWPLRVAT